MSYPYPKKPKTGTKIWRYLDFPKFVSLIDTRCLFFSRADLLDDPFEGSYSHGDKRFRESATADWGINYSDLINIRKRAKKIVFVNCWHASGIESDAMWHLYAKSNRAVAILSTYGRLCQCLPPDITISLVKYINYKTDWLPEDGLITPFLYKNQSELSPIK